MSTKTSEFVRGYQEALTDVAEALRDGGQDAVKEWLLSNLRDADFREELRKWL